MCSSFQLFHHHLQVTKCHHCLSYFVSNVIPALPLPSTKVKAPQMLLNLIVGGVILTLSMGKIGKACLQNLAELLFARINLVMLD